MQKILWLLSFLFASPVAAADFDVAFTPSPAALNPFKVEITADARITVKSVRFDMRKMKMNMMEQFTFSPTKTGDVYTVDKIVLPPCKSKDKAWFMEIVYSEGEETGTRSKTLDFELK